MVRLTVVPIDSPYNSTRIPRQERHLRSVPLVAPVSSVTLPSDDRAWLRSVVAEIVGAARVRSFSAEAASRCIDWLALAPTALLVPDVSFGDDESIMLEWENDEGLLAVLFSPAGDEWYFERGEGGGAVEARIGQRHEILALALEHVARP